MNSNFETQKNDVISSIGQAVNRAAREAKEVFKNMSKITVLIVCVLAAVFISVLPLAMFLFAAYFVIKVLSSLGSKSLTSGAAPDDKGR